MNTDWLKKIQISSGAREEFYVLMGNFISDGIPFFDALQTVDKQFSLLGDPRGWITSTAMRRMRGGEKQAAFSFGQALDGLVPSNEAMMIDAGEQSADMAGGLLRAAKIAHNAVRIRKAVAGEMVYPTILIMLTFGLLFALSTKVMPVFEQIAPRRIWPHSTQMLGTLADHAIAVMLGMFSLLAAWFGAFAASKERWTGDIRDKFDRFIFPWNMYRAISSALVMASIASLLRMGVPLSQTLDKLGETSGAWIKNHFSRIKSKMRKGKREGEAMAGDLFDKSIRWQIVLYGQLTDFPGGLDRLSDRVTEKIIEQTTRAFAVIRILAMVVIAIMIVWIYGSFMQITMAARSVGG